MRTTLLSLFISGLTFTLCLADVGPRKKITEGPKKKEYTFKEPLLFADNESTFDVFATYSAPDEKGLYNDGFGGGIGYNYFFKRHFGLGLEGYFWDGASNGDVISSVAGSIIARYPIDEWHLAPYALVGIGGSFDSVDQLNLLAGGGLEYRFTSNFGVFSDGRFVWTDKTNNYALARAGLRFIF